MTLQPHTDDLIVLTDEPLSIAEAVGFVTDARAGGIDVFLGTTRAETSPTGRQLAALDYEAYPEMALARMRGLVRRARERWEVIRIALLHRAGRVPVTAPSVVIAVASAHRAEAFEACRFLIDSLKREVPIWKKEVWDDGSVSWVEGSEVRVS